MAVLIPNMTLPETCWECPCFRHDAVGSYPGRVHGYQCNVTMNSAVETPEMYGKMETGELLDKLLYRFCPLKEVRYGLEEK